MKLIISTIVVGLAFFLMGWLFYDFIFGSYFLANYSQIQRAMADMKIWAFGIGGFIQAFFIYLIYAKGYQGNSPIAEGFRFGIYMSLFTSMPYVFYTWGGMPLKHMPVIVDGILLAVMMMIGCILTALIHGRKKDA